eukprot:TRINITY_DN30989_c0_g1_i1.p1 TRINITY_DN30989_c0_g1~~TRINITY_DN30989_c0_g1_i1.p1  ORF type:complete len:520 (-),score=137.84 TRINITY_DN30989_c0_g1_i1:70-1629(-)
MSLQASLAALQRNRIAARASGVNDWPAAAAARAGRSDLTDLLISEVLAAGDAVTRQDLELHSLRAEIAQAPVDLGVVSEQNAVLAKQAQQGLEEAAALAASHAAMVVETDGCRKKVQDLQAEKELVKARLSTAERQAQRALDSELQASRNLGVERRQGEDWERQLEVELEQAAAKACHSEAEASRRMSQLADLQATMAGCSEQNSVSARVSSADLERLKFQDRALENCLGEAQNQWRQSADRERDAAEEVVKTRTSAFALEGAADLLASELLQSEQGSEETERKALAIARELQDSTQSISHLRAEVAQNQSLHAELQESLRQEGALEQRLRAAQARAAAGSGNAAASSWQKGGDGLHGGMTAPERARSRQQDARAAQEDLAVNAALRAAWEQEARSNRKLARTLEKLEAQWDPMREWVFRLTAASRRLRDDLVATGPPEAAERLPAVPDEAACRDLAMLPQTLASLCTCLEEFSSRDLLRCGTAAASPNQCAGLVVGEVSSLTASPASVSRFRFIRPRE